MKILLSEDLEMIAHTTQSHSLIFIWKSDFSKSDFIILQVIFIFISHNTYKFQNTFLFLNYLQIGDSLINFFSVFSKIIGARSNSQRLRSDVDNLVTQCANDMWTSWNTSNTGMLYLGTIISKYLHSKTVFVNAKLLIL